MTKIAFDNGVTLTTQEDAKPDENDVIRIANAVINIGRHEYVAKDVTIRMDKGRIEFPITTGSEVHIDTKRGKASIRASTQG